MTAALARSAMALAVTAAAAVVGAPRAANAQVAVAVETAVRAGARGSGGGGVDGHVDGAASTPALGPFRALFAATADWPAAGGIVRDRFTGAARLSYAASHFGAWAGVDVSRTRLGALAGGRAVAAPNDGGAGPLVPLMLTIPLATGDSGVGSAPPPSPDDARAAGAVGVWWQRRSAVLSLSLTSGRERTSARAARYESRTFVDSIFSDSTGWVHRMRDSAVLVDPARPSRAFGIGDAEARVAWGAGRLALDGAVGARFLAGGGSLGGPALRASWGGVGATLAVAPYAALVIGGGVRPTPLASRLLRERYASAGVRLSPTRLFAPHPRFPIPTPSSADDGAGAVAAFDVRAVGGGRYAVRVRVPGARVVELSGDFTGWQPVTLARVGTTDGWELVLPLAPGTHRVNIRVDGDAWVAPPGASTVADDFNGTVGVVVVP